MVFYPVRGSPTDCGLCLRNVFGYLCAVLSSEDGGQVIGEF